MAQNFRALCRKLQTALAIQQGRRISLATFQAYSTKAGRSVTKYTLSEATEQPGGKMSYHTIFSSWSLPDIVKYLADLLQEGGTPK